VTNESLLMVSMIPSCFIAGTLDRNGKTRGLGSVRRPSNLRIHHHSIAVSCSRDASSSTYDGATIKRTGITTCPKGQPVSALICGFRALAC
jgi:hypothetical protein